MQLSGPSSRIFSYTDKIAENLRDVLLLLGRVLIASMFLLTAWFGSPNAGYLTFLGYPSPTISSSVAITVEFIVIISLVLGIGTRYGALLGIAFVVIATITAHRYWGYPAAKKAPPKRG
jgi:putative oxidoreductase